MKKLFILMSAVLFFGCSHTIKEGEVVSKKYFPAWQQATPSRVDRDISTSPNLVHPERWVINIAKKDEKTGKVKTRPLDVSKEEYLRIRVGEWVCIEQEMIRIMRKETVH